MAKLFPLGGGGNGAQDDVSGSRLLNSQAYAAPVPRAPRRGDLLIVTACAVVFIAELAIAFATLGIGGLLPFSAASVVRREMPSLPAPEVMENVARAADTAEDPLVPPAATLPIAPSPEAPTQLAAAVDNAKLTAGRASKVGKSRHRRADAAHRAPIVNGSEHHAGKRDPYAIVNEIYRPGSRLPGW
jgi:hypothetical protein